MINYLKQHLFDTFFGKKLNRCFLSLCRVRPTAAKLRFSYLPLWRSVYLTATVKGSGSPCLSSLGLFEWVLVSL